jgi:prepilin-type N-terminal cleavage/methylation domain-containing protein
MSRKSMRLSQHGFTLVELLIAMAVFSFMMMIVTAGFIQVVRIHQSGIASRATQQNARLVLDTITKQIREAGTATVGTGRTAQLTQLCLTKGSQNLEYYVDGNDNLWVGANPAPGSCVAPTVMTDWNKLNDSTVRVKQFVATTTQAVAPGLGTVMVTLTVASNNNLDALDATQTRCLPGAGSQFCAVTTLSSTAGLRGGNGQ